MAGSRAASPRAWVDGEADSRAVARQNEILASALCCIARIARHIEAFIGTQESGARTAKLRRRIWIAAPACAVLTAAAGTLIYDRAAGARERSRRGNRVDRIDRTGHSEHSKRIGRPAPLAAAPRARRAGSNGPGDAARLQAIATRRSPRRPRDSRLWMSFIRPRRARGSKRSNRKPAPKRPRD